MYLSFMTQICFLLSVLSAKSVPHHGRHSYGILNKRNITSSPAQTVVYWGRNELNGLDHYCKPDSGIDIIVLAFLNVFGSGTVLPSGTIGQSCSISKSGQPENCEALGSAIEICKSVGVKVILSLGGASGSYALSSQEEAEAIGQNLWVSYGNTPTKDNTPRPFGSTFVNGWDFDIESSGGNKYYPYLIKQLRSNFASDPSNKYFITGAPECPVPDAFMQEIVTSAQLDYIWVQFYNGRNCAVDAEISYDKWVENVANGPSADAKIFIGVAASPSAATGDSSGSKYYLEPSSLASLVNEYKSHKLYGGVMLWSAGYSDRNVNNGCTYAQQAKRIIETGSEC